MLTHKTIFDPMQATAPGAAVVMGIVSLKEAYDHYFEAVAANSDALRDRAFRLRYQVYCIEHKYEPVEENPGQRETDQFDPHSLHGLLVHRASGFDVGTVRLILPVWEGVDMPLPIWRVCSESLKREISERVPLGRTAEISRFAVAKEFRRRAEDRNSVAGGFSQTTDDPRRLIPHISLGLMGAILRMASESGMTHLFAVMEPALLRMLTRLGIYFHNLGPVVDYHGRRQPCFCDLDELLSRVAKERHDVWEILTDCGRQWPPPGES